ncbi:hypothetical protein J6590_050402 [Homalodisca vitripennis]|nr:hypothetical protein J6590_050402 [Homalodisca vitripennis]
MFSVTNYLLTRHYPPKYPPTLKLSENRVINRSLARLLLAMTLLSEKNTEGTSKNAILIVIPKPGKHLTQLTSYKKPLAYYSKTVLYLTRFRPSLRWVDILILLHWSNKFWNLNVLEIPIPYKEFYRRGDELKRLRRLESGEISSELKQAGLTNKTGPSSYRAPGPMVLSAPPSKLPIFGRTFALCQNGNVVPFTSRRRVAVLQTKHGNTLPSQLKGRVQKPNASLQCETDIARLVRSAYPSLDDEIYESLVVESSGMVFEALTQTLEFDAVRQSVQGHGRAVGAENTDREIKDWKKEIRCRRCGEKRHFRNKCRCESKEEQAEKLKSVDGEGRPLTWGLKAPGPQQKGCAGLRRDDCYISHRMDFLSTFGLELHLKKKLVTINEEEIILHSGKNCTA